MMWRNNTTTATASASASVFSSKDWAVYPRKVMEIALEAHATTLVFVHNHPDGNVSPSEFDKTLTRGLVLAACLCGSTAVYDGQMVRRDHVLHDGDVVELRI